MLSPGRVIRDQLERQSQIDDRITPTLLKMVASKPIIAAVNKEWNNDDCKTMEFFVHFCLSIILSESRRIRHVKELQVISLRIKAEKWQYVWALITKILLWPDKLTRILFY